MKRRTFIKTVAFGFGLAFFNPFELFKSILTPAIEPRRSFEAGNVLTAKAWAKAWGTGLQTESYFFSNEFKSIGSIITLH